MFAEKRSGSHHDQISPATVRMEIYSALEGSPFRDQILKNFDEMEYSYVAPWIDRSILDPILSQGISELGLKLFGFVLSRKSFHISNLKDCRALAAALLPAARTAAISHDFFQLVIGASEDSFHFGSKAVIGLAQLGATIRSLGDGELARFFGTLDRILESQDRSTALFTLLKEVCTAPLSTELRASFFRKIGLSEELFTLPRDSKEIDHLKGICVRSLLLTEELPFSYLPRSLSDWTEIGVKGIPYSEILNELRQLKKSQQLEIWLELLERAEDADVIDPIKWIGSMKEISKCLKVIKSSASSSAKLLKEFGEVLMDPQKYASSVESILDKVSIASKYELSLFSLDGAGPSAKLYELQPFAFKRIYDDVSEFGSKSHELRSKKEILKIYHLIRGIKTNAADDLEQQVWRSIRLYDYLQANDCAVDLESLYEICEQLIKESAPLSQQALDQSLYAGRGFQHARLAGLLLPEAESIGRYLVKNANVADLLSLERLSLLRNFDSYNREIISCAADERVPVEEIITAIELAQIAGVRPWKDLSIEKCFSNPEMAQYSRVLIARTAVPLDDVISRLHRVGRQVEERALLLEYLYAPSSAARIESGHRLSRIFSTDTGPLPQELFVGGTNFPNPEYVKMHTQLSEVFRGIFELHYGFGQMTFECRSPSKNDPWLMIQFGLHCAVRVDILRNFTSSRFPGPGCRIVGLKLDRIFIKDPASKDDPFARYKSAWPWLKDVFDDAEYAQYIFCRGVKIITGPSLNRYHLDGIHYSLVVWNDHFDNPGLEAGALVPTEVLHTILAKQFAPISTVDDYVEPLSDEDFTADSLTYDGLFFACQKRGLNLLNLGWASNLGGLENAYQPRSAPHFTWEWMRRSETKDGVGHVHKSHFWGGFRHRITLELLADMRPFVQLHEKVYALTMNYLGLSDIERLGRSNFHKGFTLEDEDSENGELAEIDGSESSILRRELRMLEEAYKWNLRYEGSDDAPVFVVGPTLDGWHMITPKVWLDTKNLTLHHNGVTVPLPKDGKGVPDFAIGCWLRAIKPYRDLSEYDLYFVARERVHIPNLDWVS